MAKRKSEADHGDVFRDEAESPGTQREAAGREEEVALTDESASAGETEESADESSEPDDEDSRWGFDDDESGLTTETKIGLGLIVVLLAAFAFVVYRKLDEKNSTIDVAKVVEEAETDADDNSAVTLAIPSKKTQPDEEWNAIGNQQSEPTTLGPAGQLRPASERPLSGRQTAARPVAGPINDANPFAGGGSSSVRTAPAQTARATSTTTALNPSDTNPFNGSQSQPTGLADDREVPQDLFAPQPDSERSTARTGASQVVNELDDPFFEPVSATQSTTPAGSVNTGQSEVTNAAGLETTQPGSDPSNPFAGSASGETTGADAQSAATVNVNQPAEASSDGFSPFGDVDSKDVATTAVAGQDDEPFDPFEPVQTGVGSASAAQAGSIDVRSQQRSFDEPRGGIDQRPSQPAPVDIGFSPFDDPEPAPRTQNLQGNTPTANNGALGNGALKNGTWGSPATQPATQPASPVPGQTKIYEVANGDNYWSISKKFYGTSKYFTALARANQKRIPDPTKMRPGMKVLVPSTAELVRDNPDLFKSASQPQGQTSTRQKLPEGFFVSSTGQPMYRVGDRDSLSTISLKHLGRGSRWIQIYELNRKTLKNPNDLQIGDVLLLPRDASRVTVAPSRTLNR